jgi:tryptophan synthase beta chain
VLLLKRIGKRRVLAATGAGKHGVALDTACALIGLECEIHMGTVDIAREHPNVSRVKILGSKLVPVSRGIATRKDVWAARLSPISKARRTVSLPLVPSPDRPPYPQMVQAFQSAIGQEARAQCLKKPGRLPTEVAACVGVGSNAIGLFSGFIEDPEVALVGIEPAGLGVDSRKHAATLTPGKPGRMHGFDCCYLQTEDGTPSPVHSAASGLNYPGVGPQYCLLKDPGRAHYESATDRPDWPEATKSDKFWNICDRGLFSRGFSLKFRRELRSGGHFCGEYWLCCTNAVRDPLSESSVVAGLYEQLVPCDVQDQELTFVQHGAEAARFALDLV